MTTTKSPTGHASGRAKFFKRLGVAGFLFFLIKGLLWLTVPMAIVFWNELNT